MPPCTNCNPNNIYSGSFNSLTESNCGEYGYTGLTSKVLYDGPNLPCTLINTGESLNVVFSKLDTALCAVLGDYSLYNVGCLAPIATQQEFVEAISAYVCTLRADFDTFEDVTFLNYQTSVTNQFLSITSPNITCASAGITTADNLTTVYSKYCTKFGQIDSALSLAGVNWAQCFAVPIAPTTIAEGFDLLIDQICQVNAGGSGVVLPTFNNVGSCLPGTLSATDSLEDTVNKIKTKVCTQPTFDINALTWGCTTQPSVVTTDLQSAVQAILSQLDSLKQNIPTFDPADFTVANVDNGNLCLGKSVSISGAIGTDQFVKSNAADTLPGTLEDKLQAGSNITLDFTSVAGKAIISSTGVGSAADEKVKTYVGDSTEGYLNDKVTGGSDPFGIDITTFLNTTTEKVEIIPSIDPVTFITNVLNAIKNDAALSALLCEIVSSCPSPCGSVTNAQVVQLP